MYWFRVLTLIASLTIQPLLGYAESGIVQRIVDGDTIWVQLAGKTYRTRLLCIDTLEKVENEKLLRDERRLHEGKKEMLKGGEAASNYLRTILHVGDTVRIETGPQRFDQYGRLLAYVYTKSGTDINLSLVQAGYAGVLCYAPNDNRAPAFMNALHEARSKKKGLWGNGYTLSERWVR